MVTKTTVSTAQAKIEIWIRNVLKKFSIFDTKSLTSTIASARDTLSDSKVIWCQITQWSVVWKSFGWTLAIKLGA